MKKLDKKHKCECPFNSSGDMPASMYSEEEQIGRIHAPNECKCTAGLQKYLRDGKEIYLCSCCSMPGDKSEGDDE